MKFLYSLTLLALSISSFSQRSKDGVGTISAANTIVNAYTSLTADANAGSTTINVANSTSFSVGDLLLIVQMQGTKVNAFWEDGVFNDPNNSTSNPSPTNLVYGGILDYYTCGNNEFAEVTSIPNSTSITLDCSLNNSYTYSVNVNVPGSWGNHTAYGNVQVIRVPRYSSLTVIAGGSITCPQWNGTTGGVVAVEAENNVVLSNSPSINVSGKGFRGGIKDNASSVFGGNKWGAVNRDQGGYKGESIAGDTTIYKNYAGLIGRGSLANGGGGGDAHNSGGGGGANGGVVASYNGNGNPSAGFNTQWNLEAANFATNTSSGGGRGGYSFSNSNQIVTTKAPGNTSWGGDNRRNFGGFGGRPLDYSSGRIYLGGGGGAGDGNENRAGAGGNGGGIVFLVCYGNLSGAGTIVADGANGSNTSPGCTSNDGAGGGGGGGTILLKVNGSISLTAGTALSAIGGNGGNVNFNCGTFPNVDGYGPGGSGGGGYIAATGAIPSNNVTGGTNGIQTGNGSNITANFPPNGATKGGSGGTGSLNAYTLTTSASQTLCTNQTFTVTASSTEPGSSISWYNAAIGGSAIAAGSTYSGSYPSAGTYTLFAAACSGTYRQPIIITVTSGLNLSINSATICAGQNVTLTASGATTYTWNTGPTTSSISVAPAATTIYTLNGTSGLCTGTQTTQVKVTTAPIISVANTTICAGGTTTLTASGANSYTWANGGQTTSSIVVTPTINTSYTITGATGTCTNSTTATINVSSTPTLSASSKTICAGQVATFTVSGASSYTWNPGNVIGSTYTISPTSSGTVSVIGANGTCTAQLTPSITVTPNPIITASNQTICPSQTVILTASGATTYSWNSGPTTSTISVSPGSSTIYTVIGTSSLCTNSQTVSVNIASPPSVSVTSSSICSGTSATLIASGATNYTWSPNGQTSATIVVTPTANTTYTILGSDGTCTNTATAIVNVTSTPTLVVNSVTICPAQTATLTVNGAANYTWSPGNFTGSTYTISPLSNTVVSVIGATGTCTSSATASITIGTGISISVNNPTICAGQTASLIASGATSYTWNTGPNTNTLNIIPVNTTTYAVLGTSGACSGSNTATVTVVSVPSISVTNASICSGSSATLTANGASNYTWTPNGQTTASIIENPSTSTIYTITGSNGICTNTTTATVSVTSTPTLVVASSTICQGQTATFTASGANTFTWNPGNISGNTFTISPSSNTVITIDGANGTCTSSTTATITIGSGLSITVNSATICAGETTILTANGAASYTWSNGPTTNTISVSPTNTTNYTVSGTNGTCTGSNTAVVSIAPTPALVIGTNSITLCSGQSTTLTASGATNYTWVPGNFSGSSAIVTPTINTTYTVFGSNGTCTNSAISTVNLINCNSPCQFNLGNDISFCSPINYVINGPSGYTSYSWSPSGAITQNLTATTGGTYVCNASLLSNDLVANGDFSLGNSLFSSNYIVPTFNGPFGLLSNPGTYAITTSPSLVHNNFLNFGDHTTGNGNMMVCNGASTANDIVWTETITVVPNTNYNFSAWVASTENTNAASAAQLQFSINNALIGPIYTAPLTGGVWSNFFVNWNSGLNNTAVITILDQNTASGGNDFAIDDIFYQQVCNFSDTLVITDNPIPVVTASASNSVICNGNSTTLTASGANTYTWTSGLTNGANFTPTTTATYSVIGTSAAGCTNTAVTTITVNSTPTLSVNSPSICSGQTATLIASGANTYTWSNNAIGNSQSVNPLVTTIYSVSGTDLNGCTTTLVTTSTVNVSATPTITINSATICAGQSATLSAIGATNYTWSTTETSSSINTTPAITATYSVSGDNGGCSASASTTVSVTPLPTITASSNLTNGCAPFCTNFIDIVSPSTTNIIYNFGDGTTSNLNNPNHCYTTAGSYTVTAIATNSLLGCSSSYTLPIINVNITPVADFNITEGNTVSVGTDVHFTNSSLNADTYLWEILCTGETFISTNINKIISDTGICCIDLIANTNNGCSDTISKCINVISETSILIPNVFTPNGDNKNDVFKINSTGLKSLNCSIFNRWGLQIYEWEGINGYWDGAIKSGMAPDGTYYFIVNYTDQKGITKTEKGFLTLFQD
ncbi:MAG: gliding motility-associated C-terminal domain-containing protein [Bacteroidia bacterium]|nr:gliding motility-associated C-terminal domain-containing protein [Bacteroidia bacterium]